MYMQFVVGTCHSVILCRKGAGFSVSQPSSVTRLHVGVFAVGPSRVLLGEAAWGGREAARAVPEEPEDGG